MAPTSCAARGGGGGGGGSLRGPVAALAALGHRDLTDGDLADLEAFLGTLTGPIEVP